MSKGFDRTGTGQVEKHPVLVLFDRCGDVAAGEDDRRGLRLGQGAMLQGVRP